MLPIIAYRDNWHSEVWFVSCAASFTYRQFRTTSPRVPLRRERLSAFLVATDLATGCRHASWPSMRGVPFTFVRVDRRETCQASVGAALLTPAATCPLWNVLQKTFANPGRSWCQIANARRPQLPVNLARTVEGRPV